MSDELVPLTREQVAAALPPNLKNAATQAFTDQINAIASDPIVAEQIRNNFISYSSIMRDGKFKTEDYLNAVCYVSYKLMGKSNREAYEKTFPHRMTLLISKGTKEKDIAAYVSAYNKGKLVNLIMEQCIVPSWVLNQDIYQKAINTQYDIMTDPDVSAKVRSDAADSILNHLKKPEASKIQLDVGLNESSGLGDLTKKISELASQQKQLIESGVGVREIAASTLIEAEARDVTDQN